MTGSVAQSLEVAKIVEVRDYLGNLAGETKLGFDNKVDLAVIAQEVEGKLDGRTPLGGTRERI